jgi:hypothetical protein
MGVTSQELQTLQHIAAKTGTGEQAIVSMFENIQKARDEALKGNQEMITSFAKLGVSIADLSKLKSGELFSKVGAALNIPGGIRGSQDMFLRQAAQSVTGTPENVLDTVTYGINELGGNFEDAGNKLAAAGDIVKNEDVQQLSTVWAEILTSLKEAGVQLVPLANLLLPIVKIFVDALGALAEFLGGIAKLLIGIITLDSDKIMEGVKSIFGIILNGIFGILNIIPTLISGFLSLVAKLAKKVGLSGAASKIESLSGSIKELSEGYGEELNKTWGFGAGTAKRGQALGEAGAMIVSGGETALVKGGSQLALKGAVGAEKLGMVGTSGKLLNVGEKMEKYAAGGGMAGRLEEAAANKMSEVFSDMIIKSGKNPTHAELAAYRRASGMGSRAVFGAARVGALAEGLTPGIVKNNEMRGKGITPTSTSPIIPFASPLMSIPGMESGGANLRIGGMFGTATMRIINLNTRMVELLTMIQSNTSRVGVQPNAGRSGGFNTGNSGGI